MPKNIIRIDSNIGNWGYSHQYVKYMLDKAGKGPITIEINSLGGDTNHALSIHDLFVKHGDCHAEIYGMSASSATIIAMGCKTIKMSKNALILVHRCSNWIDNWGPKNESEIQQIIDNLEAMKDDQKKLDLKIADIYFQRSRAENKSHEAIIAQMKKANWLTSNEAKEFGFIDEDFEMKAEPIPSNFAAMVFNNELPPLPFYKTEVSPNTKIETSLLSTMKEGFSKLTSLFSNQHTTMDKYPKCAKVYGVENDAALQALGFSDEVLANMEAHLPEAEASNDATDTAIQNAENTTTEHSEDANMITAESVAKIVNDAIAPLQKEISDLKSEPGDNSAQAPQNHGAPHSDSKENTPVTSENASFEDNFAAMRNEYKPQS